MDVGTGRDYDPLVMRCDNILRRGLALAIALAPLLPAAARAQTPSPADADTLSLSDAEKADLLSHDTEASVDAARTGLGSTPGADRGIHGEIGGLIGSRGTRAAYGVAAIPLGQNSQATVSFESSRTDPRR